MTGPTTPSVFTLPDRRPLLGGPRGIRAEGGTGSRQFAVWDFAANPEWSVVEL
ncbi:hypothetical protein ACQPWY_22015 [Pseudonocardia xinjiangensis]|uniref:hypothetical protein n=1 Tax=Pseudonocardia xinjiangensis TaxID=75289 RepID=UPI003D8A77D7